MPISPTRSVDQQGLVTWTLADGTLHHADGPAALFETAEQWWRDGQPHRSDGPSVTTLTGLHRYHLRGREVDAALIAVLERVAAAAGVDTDHLGDPALSMCARAGDDLEATLLAVLR